MRALRVKVLEVGLEYHVISRVQIRRQVLALTGVVSLAIVQPGTGHLHTPYTVRMSLCDTTVLLISYREKPVGPWHLLHIVGRSMWVVVMWRAIVKAVYLTYLEAACVREQDSTPAPQDQFPRNDEE